MHVHLHMLNVEKERRLKSTYSQSVNEKGQGIDYNHYLVYFCVGKKINDKHFKIGKC